MKKIIVLRFSNYTFVFIRINMIYIKFGHFFCGFRMLTQLKNVLEVPKHFPFGKGFLCLRENVRRWQAPYVTRMGKINTFFRGDRVSHWISPTRIYVKLDYISSLLPQTACLGKICGPRYLGPKLAKSAIFSIFFSFSNITFEIFILEENFYPHKCWRSRLFLAFFSVFRI